jgi:hypothetical protein
MFFVHNFLRQGHLFLSAESVLARRANYQPTAAGFGASRGVASLVISRIAPFFRFVLAQQILKLINIAVRNHLHLFFNFN